MIFNAPYQLTLMFTGWSKK